MILSVKDRNYIGPEGAAGISTGIKNLTNLEYLELSISIANNILTEGAKSIGDSFTGLPNLKKLQFTINSNYINAEGADGIG